MRRQMPLAIFRLLVIILLACLPSAGPTLWDPQPNLAHPQAAQASGPSVTPGQKAPKAETREATRLSSPQSDGSAGFSGSLSGGGGTSNELPGSLGWYEIPNTQMQSACPPNNFGNSGYSFSDSCHDVVDAWGGGAADTKRNRLIVWGGGHSGYSGNEVYALDLNNLTVKRLTDPALPLSTGCTEELSGPTPNSRHTYDSLVYIADSDLMLSFSGSLAPTGCASGAAWKFQFPDFAWTRLTPSGPPPVYNGGIAAASYDPNRKLVFISTESYGSFASYNYGTNTYTLLNKNAMTDYHETSVIDPKRKLFYLFGGGFAESIDISGKDRNYKLSAIKASECGFIQAAYPGVDFDREQNVVVGWGGGNTVYFYNPDTDSCSSVVYPNGPGAQQANGTSKRFSYFPGLNIFALVNSFTQNAYTLRLTGGRPAQASGFTLVPSAEPSSADTPDVPATSGEQPGAAAESDQAKTKASSTKLGGKSRQAATSPEQDFHERCHAPGVIKCVGWDDPLDFIPAHGGGGYADGLYPASDGTYQGTMDTSIKTSGAGSLRFTIRPNATSNWTGYWRANFGPLGKLTAFGPHTTLYLQFRLRLDSSLLNFRWNNVGDTGWKVFIAYGPIPGASCTGAQFVQENTYQTNVATAYTSCGNPSLYSNNGVPPMLIEQGDYNCPYKHEGGYAAPKCFVYPAESWMTEYWVVETGDYGQPNTHFTAYIAAAGQPLKRFIDLANFKFNAGADPSDALETILLQPYLSGANGSKTNPTAHMWFDELIISTKPIAAPKY